MFQLVNTNMLLPVSQKGLRWAGAAGGARQVLKLGTHLKYPKVPSLPAFHIVPWGEVKPALWPTEMIPWNRTILIHPDSCGISCRLIVVYQTRVDSKNSLSCSAELIKGPCLGPISEKKQRAKCVLKNETQHLGSVTCMSHSSHTVYLPAGQ
jgi:hypothetical protein